MNVLIIDIYSILYLRAALIISAAFRQGFLFADLCFLHELGGRGQVGSFIGISRAYSELSATSKTTRKSTTDLVDDGTESTNMTGVTSISNVPRVDDPAQLAAVIAPPGIHLSLNRDGRTMMGRSLDLLYKNMVSQEILYDLRQWRHC